MQATLTQVGEAVVEIEFLNESLTSQFLLLPLIDEDRAGRSLFEFDPIAPYIGALVKRPPFTPDELEEILPGESITRRFDISKCYKLSEGVVYSILYRIPHPVEGILDPLHWSEVESQWLTLSLDF